MGVHRENNREKYSYSNSLAPVNDSSGVIAIERINPDSSAPNTLVFLSQMGLKGSGLSLQ